MVNLKTLAIIYEADESRSFKNVLDKFAYSSHCFIPIIVNPKLEQSYFIFKDSEISQSLIMKLEAAQEIYIINPKGHISICLNQILFYAREKGKPVHYMYKYCYRDCKYRKKQLYTISCGLSSEIYTIPSEHKLLPACKSYARIYDDWISETKSTYKVIELEPSDEISYEISDEVSDEPADAEEI